MDSSLEEAIRYISSSLKEEGTDLKDCIEKACTRFDLTPLQAEFLYNKYILKL